MKKSLLTLVAAALFGLSGALLVAGESPSEATILKLTGSVQVQLPGQSVAVDLHVGDLVPQGATLITGPNSEVYVQPFSGTVSTVKENATVVVEKLSLTTDSGIVTKQNTLLNLKAGNLVSTIDPAKRAINNYGVRTPKGVAAARGTSYSVSVSADGFSIAATADMVTFTTSTGAVYSIQAGMISITPAGGSPQPPISLASAAATDPSVGAIVRDAVTTLSTVVQNNLGGLSADSTITLASQVAGVASAALPDQAAGFTSQIVTAVTAPTAVTSGGSNSSSNAVASVTSAAVTAAPQEASQIAGAAATAAPAQAGVIAAAATQAAPGSTEAVTQSVATATGQTTVFVTQAIQTSTPQATQAVQQTTPAVQNVITPVVTTPTPVDTSVVSPH
jgi:hypothetical protein